jgi:hypothetical protein
MCSIHDGAAMLSVERPMRCGEGYMNTALAPVGIHATTMSLLALALSTLSIISVSAAPLKARQFSSSHDKSFGPPPAIIAVIVVVAVVIGITAIGGLIWKFVRVFARGG